jgi:hypothetical protein
MEQKRSWEDISSEKNLRDKGLKNIFAKNKFVLPAFAAIASVNIPYLNCFWFVFCGGGKVLAGFDEVVL